MLQKDQQKKKNEGWQLVFIPTEDSKKVKEVRIEVPPKAEIELISDWLEDHMRKV